MEKEISLVHLQLVRDKQVPYGEVRLDNPSNAARFMSDFLGEMDREYVIVCPVDNSMRPTYIQIAGIGTVNSCLVSVPETFKAAILSNASGILLFHTHPSGNPQPSHQDVDITTKIRTAGDMLDIPLRDHIILGAEGKYYSFRESGFWKTAA